MKDCILNGFSLDIAGLGLLRYFGTCCLKIIPQSKCHIWLCLYAAKKIGRKMKNSLIHLEVSKYPDVWHHTYCQVTNWLGCSYSTCLALFYIDSGYVFRQGSAMYFMCSLGTRRLMVSNGFFPSDPHEQSSVFPMLLSPTKMQVQIFYCFLNLTKY